MESRLVVKNFGPIKSVELDLRNVNVFIGPQATGKSALAKIYTIFKAPRKFFQKTDSEKKELKIENEKTSSVEFAEVFKEYNIYTFLNDETEIRFESQLHTISYKNGSLNYTPKLLETISALELLSQDFNSNKEAIVKGFHELSENFIFFYLRVKKLLLGDDKGLMTMDSLKAITDENCSAIFDVIKGIEEDLSVNTALYIPAERNFINIIKKSALNLILNKVPIPKHILSFGAELEKLETKEIDLDFIQRQLKYRIVNGEDTIFIDSEHSIKLTEAASGIQSVVPILAPILNRSGISHRSFVIEEPELNLFPTAQYQLIQFLESKRNDPYWEDYGTIHTYTTHSPYILSALNNLLYASKVRDILISKDPDSDEAVNAMIKKIIKAEIRPESFTAYQINNGFAESIFNRDSGLIETNYIDMSSDKISDDFEELMELTK